MAINYNSSILSLYAGNVANDAAYQSPGTYGLPAAAVSGRLTAITVGTPGSYTTLPTVNISGSGGGTATARMKVLSATIAADGTAGTDGSATVTGTTGTGTRFQATVTISGGAIASVNSVTVAGLYSVLPTNVAAEPVTGGNLSGATLNLTFAVDSVVIGAAGQYASVPSITFSTGAAAATATLSNDGERRLLTLIEVVRSYFATTTAEEANTAKDVLYRMLSRANPGGTYDASTISTSMQKGGVVRYGKRPRSDQ